MTLEVQGRILLIRMEREDKRNAVDPHMTAALDQALNQLEDDPDLWCGTLVGGEKAFSAGTDLADTAGTPTERGGPYGVIRRRRRTPLIAAVDGMALGGGFEIALACDMIVAARSAQFGLPETARGLIPTCCGLFRGWQNLPLTIAKQLVLTGRPMPAERAYELGLVNVLTEDGDARAGALELAQQVCENSPFAIGESLSVMQDALDALDADERIDSREPCGRSPQRTCRRVHSHVLMRMPSCS